MRKIDAFHRDIVGDRIIDKLQIRVADANAIPTSEHRCIHLGPVHQGAVARPCIDDHPTPFLGHDFCMDARTLRIVELYLALQPATNPIFYLKIEGKSGVWVASAGDDKIGRHNGNR